MQILRSKAELKEWRARLSREESLGFVPTMGALHLGHLSLIQLARSQCTHALASIFVNPLQFGQNEDLSNYPRPFEQDCDQLEKAGTAALFYPQAQELYPPGASTYVTEEKVSAPLCGVYRPGHFRGVTTIVLKLFNIVQPDVAYFGQKDAQQCAVIERMVRDLDVPIRILRGPTVREQDGLAMSSRNAYLSAEERARAPRVFQSLLASQAAFKAGERDPVRLTQIGRSVLEQDPGLTIQYWEIRDSRTLELWEGPVTGNALAAVAVYLGRTRLIDNLMLSE